MAPLRVMSFNIRYDNPRDGDHRWPQRLPSVVATLEPVSPDLIGVQEARASQVRDLAAILPGYRWLGVGRDDGADQGEYAAIFYRHDRLEPMADGTFWLSDTPDVPGQPAWGAHLRRIVTWAHFLDRANGARWWHFNTHFDHESPLARQESAGLLLEHVRLAGVNQLVVVTGDFNCTPDMPAYQRLTAPGSGLVDAQGRSATPHEGSVLSFHPFFDGKALVRIDYVFVSRSVRVLCHRLVDQPAAGRFPSDHFPIVVDLAPPDPG